ncbi:hypothetical protein EE612_054179 [Oryza sativa]|nr:hypothetical protein EE612_054179 [Oryza sativa]
MGLGGEARAADPALSRSPHPLFLPYPTSGSGSGLPPVVVAGVGFLIVGRRSSALPSSRRSMDAAPRGGWCAWCRSSSLQVLLLGHIQRFLLEAFDAVRRPWRQIWESRFSHR